jgi:hypothetical protein
MAEVLKVHSCGKKVKTVLSNVEGMITAFTVRFDYVQYEISYFHNGELRTMWMNESEFVISDKKDSIGFKQFIERKRE